MEKTISTNQTGLLLAVFTIALKLSALPAICYSLSGASSYVTITIALILDFIGTIVILKTISKLPKDMTFFDLISRTMSKFVAITIYIILFIYFLLKSIITLQELHDYYIATLFQELNPFFFLLSLFLIMLFICQKPFRALGRALEVCFWPLLIGITFTLILPIGDMEIINLLPICEDGVYPIFNGLVHTAISFGDFLVLLIFMGRISWDAKKPYKKVVIYMLSAVSFILNFYVVFIGCFGDTAVGQTLALGELPLHNANPGTIGRLEWITIIIWTVVLIIQAGILGKCSCDCLKQIFHTKKDIPPALVVSISMVVLIMASYMHLSTILKVGTSTTISIICYIIHWGILAILIIGYIVLKFKNKKTLFPNMKSNIKGVKNNV